MPGYRKLAEPKKLYQNVVSVSPDTALEVQATGATFVLLICNRDQSSLRMEALVQTALQHHQPGVLALMVKIDNMLDATRMTVTMVPQLRVYRGGHEVARHRGTMDYGRLLTFLKGAVI